MFDDHDFDGVLDFVEDLGADPTGEEPIDNALEALNTLRGAIRVRVPDGTYLCSEGVHRITSPQGGARIFEGEVEGQATFEVPDGHTGPWLSFETDGKFHDIDIDRTAQEVSPEVLISPYSRFEFSEVTVHGRETLPSNTQGNGVLSVIGRKSTRVLIDNFNIPEGTTTGGMGGSQSGIVVGPQNKGTVRIDNCEIRECSSHGIDASRSVGPVKIRNGHFQNNNRSQIRFCGPGSTVESSLIVVDLQDSTLAESDYVRTAGILNEALTPRSEARPPSGGVVSGCSVAIRSGSKESLYGAYHGTALGGGMALHDSDFVVDVSDVPAVLVDEPERILDDYPPLEPLGIEIKNCAFRGSAQDGWAVVVNGRPTSSMKNSCVAMPGARMGYDLPHSAEIAAINNRGSCTGPPL